MYDMCTAYCVYDPSIFTSPKLISAAVTSMPPKKSTGGQKAVVPDPTVLPDGGDPALVAMAIVDKKKRNLEKRKVS